ncbi:MAG: hypothetical protein NZ927_03425 [Candidatus Calescibacterium sp.]|nr:hypothetical protein [Candidatus Calescibacterium sp.]MCX7734666.1 hypothetical protein [bacterium]MDW8087790.1 hypothetical protein [Candidatus Calescibacterium sp.]
MSKTIQNFKGEKMIERAENLYIFQTHDNQEPSNENQLILLDNVQFIYELALAQLELQSLGANFEVKMV